MPHARKFDWDEAKRLRSDGMTYAAIASILGVSKERVGQVLNQRRGDAARARHAIWQRETKPWIGVCPDCGGPASNGLGQHKRCRDCHFKRLTTSVREHTLRCSACRYWLPDEDFPHAHANKARRQRHAICRPCQNVARQLNREANRERERAYDRERKRRTRAAP